MPRHQHTLFLLETRGPVKMKTVVADRIHNSDIRKQVKQNVFFSLCWTTWNLMIQEFIIQY